MAFTRDRIQTILSNESITIGEKVDQIFAMHGQTLSDGYISKKEADAMRDKAVSEVTIPDPKESDAYKALTAEYESYKTKQTARTLPEFKDVKPKFFDQVYDALDRKEGAKPVSEQLEELKKNYSEYFAEEKKEEVFPAFAQKTEGSQPKGEGDSFSNYWGFAKRKGE